MPDAIQELWRFVLPTQRNDGEGTYWATFPKWELACLTEAGGYTDCGTRRGAWRDPATGRIYRENMRHYEIACDHATAQTLLNVARRFFRDQETFLVAHVGTAVIHEGRTHINVKQTPDNATVHGFVP